MQQVSAGLADTRTADMKDDVARVCTTTYLFHIDVGSLDLEASDGILFGYIPESIKPALSSM